MVYDVVIVGAGPAGASAARFLAGAGATVALVDAARFPRAKPCAGWLSDRAVRDYPFVDAARRKVKATPFKRLTFHSPDFSLVAQYGSRAHAGHVVARSKFDAALVQAARGAGAKTILGKKVAAVETGECQVVAVLENGRRLAGRIVVGADGVHSTVAQTTGLRPGWGDEHLVVTLSKTISLTARQRTACFGASNIHVSLGFGGASGYAWAFPGARHASIGIGVRGREAGQLKELYAAWVERLKAEDMLPKRANLDKPQGAAVPAGAAVDFENHVGKRTVLIGDAGGFAAAASGEGIYPAIVSAEVASDCILKALAAEGGKTEGTTCQDELLKFRTRWRRRMAPHLQMPNVNITFLLPLIFTNQEICDRFAKAFLFGENL
ncbi:MAG TPA: geranylgeranyl reductase family protein [Phycisphaerae bacterium]|nr:geranylgeranyl reductase family protein [Phycisphaerae bacterium]